MGQKTLKKSTNDRSGESSHPPAAHGAATLLSIAGFGLSAGLLTVIQEPFGLSWFAWVAWVPFVLACRDTISTRRLLITAYVVGLCYWVGNMYWLYIVTLPGYITFSFAQAFYWPVLAYGVRFVRQKQWPLFLFAPVLFVGAEAVQGYLYTGFSWYYLAHSQYANLPLIQICDIFGALGVSVLVAMVNGVICDWVLDHKQKQGLIGRLTSPRFYFTILTVLLLAGSCWYGHFRLSETPDYLIEGPLVGAVQPNVPSHVKEEVENAQEILDDLIHNSNQCFEAGADLVLWPETMVLAPMNPQYISYCSEFMDSSRFRKQILEHCNGSGYVLFGAHAATLKTLNGQYDIADQYNSAFLYRPDGQADPSRYDKIHLVPFGEYIPFKKSVPWLYKMILFLSPYDYDYNLTAGTNYTTFEVDIDETTYRFGVLICYEDTDPTVTRKHILDENGNKKCDWLVNISNDGWYVRFKDKQVRPMAELSQRTAISVFRCVENRISIVRSVKTGISCLIEPTGRIHNDTKAGNLPKEAMARQGIDGWFVDTVPIDSRVTVFCRWGRWLNVLLAISFMLTIGVSLMNSRNNNKKQEG